VNQLKLVTIDRIAVGTLHCIAVSTQGDVSHLKIVYLYIVFIVLYIYYTNIGIFFLFFLSHFKYQI